MDLNYLFQRQQIERLRARDAACAEARQAHLQLAALYEAEIETLTNGRVQFVSRVAPTIHQMQPAAQMI